MVAVLLAGGLTQCSFLALLRVNQICARAGISDFYVSILLLTGVLSLLIPAMAILGQNNIKRAFAYSSVEQMGILVIGLALGGAGLFGALLHMITNALSKVVMFLTAGSIAQKYGSSRGGDVRGVIHIYPVTGLLLILALFAGTGMFPFATFHSELMVLNAAVMSRHYALAGIFALSLMIIFIGMARLILDMVYGKPTDPQLPMKENMLMNAPILMAAAALIALGFWVPGSLVRVISDAVIIVSGK
jgi:hydrogenase-4 component F